MLAKLPMRSRVAVTASSSPSSHRGPGRCVSRGRARGGIRFSPRRLAGERLPGNPEGWLLQSRAASDRQCPPSSDRRSRGHATADSRRRAEDAAAQAERDMQIPDKRLALLFACAHPAIEAGIRAPLMLQVVLGLDGETIASAFLVSPAAMRKRLSRRRRRSSKPVFRSRFPSAKSCRTDWTPYWRRFMRASRKVGPTRAVPMRSVAI